MGSDMQNFLLTMLMIGASITGFVLFVKYVAVPLFRGIGTGIGMSFRGIGWFFTHIFEYIGGTLSDIVRFIGALLAMVVLVPLVPLNIIIGRWSAAGHFAEGVKRECQVGSLCVYRAVIQRPLKLVLLHGLLEGLEQRVPEAMHGAPGSDHPSKRTGQFDGYTILGSLRAGGSGAKLYIAQATNEKRRALKGRAIPDRVVIKSFALTEGSSLPQIVRESRALECAKQLGHVIDHGMDEHRFFYVMPYHPGDHLGILARQMHGECGGRGLDQKRLNLVMSYTHDLLSTLSAYHKGGLWHKDVKPENVIVHDGEAHLVDLGLVTPLRSAMTLTTHGTEYFRDPEMVRQALRGVRVHQVDGAKFDIYAVGAVLYFLIENTFPAHGGLSRFATKNPEALRWIVRRAMTEYHQRYTTADEMLADLKFVAAASDAFAVKPAELPSMRGGVPAMPIDAPATVVTAASTPSLPKNAKEPAFTGFGLVAGIDESGSFCKIGVGALNLDENGRPIPAQPSTSTPRAPRPRLTVTNWWTGEYRAEDLHSADATQGSASEQARNFRQQAYAFRDQAETISRQAREGVMSARKAAREQIKAARARARDIRSRAVAHRHRVVPRSRTSVATVLIGALSVVFLFGILAATFFTYSARTPRFITVNSSSSNGPPVLVAIDSSLPISESTRREIKRIAAEYRGQGYNVLESESEPTSEIIPALREWRKDQSEDSDLAIEDYLEAHNAFGLVHVTVEKNKRGNRAVVNDLLVRSSRPGASERRYLDAQLVPPAPAMPYLLINDHPTKADVQIAAEIERRLKAYRERGWSIVTNDDVEVHVRNVLPVGPLDPKIPLSPKLFGALADSHLGGILRIDGMAGNEPPQQRVTITRIDGGTCEAPDEATMPLPPNVVEVKPLGAAEAATARSN